MNKRKLLTLAMTLCMVAILAIGGTLAYFTDTEKATNVLSVGNVDINLEEYMKDEKGDKVAFDSEKALNLYPMTDEQGMNTLNKLVDVHNVSETEPAYIRTIIAFEKVDGAEGVPGQLVHYAALKDYTNGTIFGTEGGEYYGDVAINSENYEIYVFNTYTKAAIPAGGKLQSLQTVWLDKDFDMKDMSLLGEDEKLNVLVVAQAVQTKNFDNYDAAFAATFELTDDNIKSWFEATDNAVINDLNK